MRKNKGFLGGVIGYEMCRDIGVGDGERRLRQMELIEAKVSCE